MNSTLPAPIAVWDCNDRKGPWWRHMEEASAWAAAHLPRANGTVYAEFYLIDTPFAVVRRAATNADGRKYADPATGTLAMEPPATVMLTALPPEHLRH